MKAPEIFIFGQTSAQRPKRTSPRKTLPNKRKILRAALAKLPEQILTALPKLRESIIWILDETDKLQEQRNDISHVPLHLVASPSEPVTQENQHHLLANAEVKPHHWANNPRAKRLVGLDILAEYRYCRDAAVILRNHTLSLGRSLEAKLRHHPQPPFPPLPPLPVKPSS